MNLNKFQAVTLTREVAGATYSDHPKNGCFIGFIHLNECLNNLDDLNIFYVRQQIRLQDCDIFIDITTTNSAETVTTPVFVNKILKHIDCQLTFSFHPPKTTDTL